MEETPMSVSIVGAGNVATHLAVHLVEQGVTIKSIYSRTLSSANELASKLGCDILTTDSLAQLAEADIYIVSVRDDALPQIVAEWPANLRSGVVLHTAGSIAMEVISTTSSHYGVLYPMQTFSKNKAVDFNTTTCFIEGNDEVALNAASTLSHMLFGHTRQLSSAQRQQLHLAAVFACNFSNHMYSLAFEILEHHGIDPNCLLPLISETAEKLTKLHPREAQTGPACRCDLQVVNKHLDALAKTPELQEIYRLLSRSIMNHCKTAKDEA